MIPGRWHNDLESLEAISQDDDAKQIFLRMAAMSQAGEMGRFVTAIVRDDELDEATKDMVVRLAEDDTFLLAVEDYLQRTRHLH